MKFGRRQPRAIEDAEPAGVDEQFGEVVGDVRTLFSGLCASSRDVEWDDGNGGPGCCLGLNGHSHQSQQRRDDEQFAGHGVLVSVLEIKKPGPVVS